MLIMVAEGHPEDSVANRAMKILRQRYSQEYFWCQDCDGMVVTPEFCCLNQTPEIEIELNWT